jgi:hypothetical protein
MRKAAFVSLALVALLVSSSTAYADCTCKSAKINNGWCQDCKVGYIAGVKIASKKLYDAQQGKTIADTAKLKCDGCKEAVAKNGKCHHCKLGFANKTAYKSMPAYCLARGQAKDPAKIACPSCRAHAGDHGWCDTCAVGMVGPLAFKDKETYNEAVKSREMVLAASLTAKKCESCAVAMVTDGTCDSCKISFKDGKKVTKPEEKETETEEP